MANVRSNPFGKVFLSIVMVILSLALVAQKSNYYKRDWSVKVTAGPTIYLGDADPGEFFLLSEKFNKTGKAWNISVSKKLGSVVSAEGRFVQGSVAGIRRSDIQVFESKFLEGSLNLFVNLSTLIVRYNSENRRANIYMRAGAGYISWRNSMSNLYTGEGIKENPDRETESAVFPAGLAFSYKLSHKWELNLESTFSFTASEWLDGKATGKNDNFNFTAVGLTYNLFNGKRKPKLKIAENQDDELLPVAVVTFIENSETENNLVKSSTLEENLLDFEAEYVHENPWEDVLFKVQIFASGTRQNTDKFAQKHNIKARIEENRVGDWFKYTIGEFPRYSRAKEYRNKLVYRNKVMDAFVVAYKGDDQVSLSELMRGKRSVETREPIPMGVAGEGVTFSVQVLAAKNLSMSVEEFKAKYEIEEDTRIIKYGDIYQLVSGNFENYRGAKDFRRRLIEKGLPDAFVVAYQNGDRISIDNAFQSKKIIHN
ncbi:MAG: SPOR domain-containing protein [Bacteroidales bacterium]|nr:SPOR domain-containing protein [Bacteroidales bacterium]